MSPYAIPITGPAFRGIAGAIAGLASRRESPRALTVFVAVFFLATACRAESYRNDDYRYTIAIPDGYAHCAPGAADHGPGIYLDGKPALPDDGCALHPTRRVMTFWAEYNTIPQDLGSEARVSCKPRKSMPVVLLRDLRYGDNRSIACRIDHADGWIEYFAVTQSAVRRPADPPDIFYGAWLHTNRQSRAEDLRTFTAVLESLRLVKPL